MNKTLFEIGADMAALNDLLDELQGDVSGDGESELIDGWFTENQEALLSKLDGYGSLVMENTARADALKAEAARIADLSKAHANRAAKLKERLHYFMETQGQSKLETGRFKFTVCANPQPQLVVSAEAIDLPEQYRRIEYKADNAAIRAALADGVKLPFALLGDRGTHLRIK